MKNPLRVTSNLTFKEMARSSAYGLLVVAVLLGLGYVYPLLQLPLLVAAVAGVVGGFGFGREYQKSDEREEES
jgi:DMSO reductase anchor subunit